MPKDYAKTSRNRQSRSNPRSSGGNGLWIVTLLLIALFGVGLFYLKQHNNHLVKTEPTPVAKDKEPVKKSTTKTATTTTQQNFDFYTLLPKSQTPTTTTPSAGATSTPATNKTNVKPGTTQTAYIVQIGEFKEYASADELKAQVVLQGYEVNISDVKKNNLVLHRVWLGPYPTRAQAVQQQKALLNNQIKSVVVTLKKVAQSP